MPDMRYDELLDLFDEITAILETKAPPSEKIERIETLMFEPVQVQDENDVEEDEDEPLEARDEMLG